MRPNFHSVLLTCLLAASTGDAARAQPATTDSAAPAAPLFPQATPEEVGLSSDELRALGHDIASWVAQGDPVGAELLIVRNDRTVFHEAWGWSDREAGRPMEKNSIFRMRSMTKPFIGTAIQLLIEEGALVVDDAVALHLPSFDNERSRGITIRQLLQHTSGLGNHEMEEIGLERRSDEFASLRDLADAIGTIGPTRARGAFHYSSSGSAILGAVVEEVSGLPLERFLAKRIFEPLGMTDTHTAFRPDVDWAPRMNSTYGRRRGSCAFERYWDPGQPQHHPFFRASGGLYSTTTDYARFLATWLDGGRWGDTRLLSKDTVVLATQPAARHDAMRGYGWHWMLLLTDGDLARPAAFGHGGSDGTLGLAIPAHDTLVLFFTQSRGSASRNRFVQRLARVEPFGDLDNRPQDAEIVLQWESLSTATSEEVGSEGGATTASSERLQRYVGAYRTDRLEHRISAEEGGLFYTFDRSDARTPLRPLSDGVFLVAHPCSWPIFRLTFPPDGPATGYRIESSDGWREEFDRVP